MSYTPAFDPNKSAKRGFTSAARFPDQRPGYPRPYSLRLTWEERDQLKRDAGKQSWAAYIRSQLFGDKASRRRKSRVTDADTQAIARLAALLGQTRIPNNLNQLAKASNSGGLVMDDETKKDLHEACAHIAHMRQLLMSALGVQEK